MQLDDGSLTQSVSSIKAYRNVGKYQASIK